MRGERIDALGDLRAETADLFLHSGGHVRRLTGFDFGEAGLQFTDFRLQALFDPLVLAGGGLGNLGRHLEAGIVNGASYRTGEVFEAGFEFLLQAAGEFRINLAGHRFDPLVEMRESGLEALEGGVGAGLGAVQAFLDPQQSRFHRVQRAGYIRFDRAEAFFGLARRGEAFLNLRLERVHPLGQHAGGAFGAQLGLLDGAFDAGSSVGERAVDARLHAFDAVGEVGEARFDPALDGDGFVLGKLCFLVDMGRQLAERALERLQRLDIVMVAVVLLEAAHFRLQGLVRLAHLVDQAFNMAGDGHGGLFGVLQAGDEAVDRVVDAIDGEGGTRLGGFDAAGQPVEGGGRIRRVDRRRRGRAGTAGIRVGGFARLGLFDHGQEAVEVFPQGDALRQGRFAGRFARPLVGAELAPSGLAHTPAPHAASASRQVKGRAAIIYTSAELTGVR